MLDWPPLKETPETFLVDNCLVPPCGPCSVDLSGNPDPGAGLFQVLRVTGLQRLSSCANWSCDEGRPKSCLLHSGLHDGLFRLFIGKEVLFSLCTNPQIMPALVLTRVRILRVTGRVIISCTPPRRRHGPQPAEESSRRCAAGTPRAAEGGTPPRVPRLLHSPAPLSAAGASPPPLSVGGRRTACRCPRARARRRAVRFSSALLRRHRPLCICWGGWLLLSLYSLPWLWPRRAAGARAPSAEAVPRSFACACPVSGGVGQPSRRCSPRRAVQDRCGGGAGHRRPEVSSVQFFSRTHPASPKFSGSFSSPRDTAPFFFCFPSLCTFFPLLAQGRSSGQLVALGVPAQPALELTCHVPGVSVLLPLATVDLIGGRDRHLSKMQ